MGSCVLMKTLLFHTFSFNDSIKTFFSIQNASNHKIATDIWVSYLAAYMYTILNLLRFITEHSNSVYI